MAQKTDLNVAPYYDDFKESKNFHRVLFRPGYAVQARELTQLQSILQNQIERFGSHVFQEGTVVIPGGITVSNEYKSVALSTAFGGETIDVTQYYDAISPVTIVGATSGVRAITHTTAYAANANSATTHTSAAQTGTAVTAGNGIFYVRGQFVQMSEQTIVLSDTDTSASKRIGFTISESLVTPEDDESLTDNATGSSNFAAKGAHRLKIELVLTAIDTTSTDDDEFVEIARVKDGEFESDARPTDYSVLGDTLARRTFDESGDYTVRPFQIDARELVTNRHKDVEFQGVYAVGATTDDGNVADESRFALAVSPGKAYVKGYEIEKTGVTFKDISKAREFDTVNAGSVNTELGNFVKITNVYGQPDVTSITGETTPYKTIQLHDDVISTRGTASGTQIGVARARTIEYNSGTAGNTAVDNGTSVQTLTRQSGIS